MSDRKPGGKTSEVRPLRSSSKRTKRGIGLAIVCLITGLASAGVYRMRQTASPANLPMAPARKGDFSVIVRSRGELKARRCGQITAAADVPDLRIVLAAAPSSPVKAGGVVSRFHPRSDK